MDGWTGMTDFTGEVVFNPPQGWYTLVVTHRDYTPMRRRVAVLKDMEVTVELTPMVRTLGW